MSRRALRLLGSLLILYGLAGTVLLGVLAGTIAPPLDEIEQLVESVGEQREQALAALDEASSTARETALAVRNVDVSLVQAKTATDRASTLAGGVAQSMREMALAMTVEVLGFQPLIGLVPSFEASAANLDLLATDLGAIGIALDATRTDATTVAGGMDDLASSIEDLRVSVAGGPDLSVTIGSLEPLRLGLLALVGWLLVGSLGCVVAGLAMWWASRRRTVVVTPAVRVDRLD